LTYNTWFLVCTCRLVNRMAFTLTRFSLIFFFTSFLVTQNPFLKKNKKKSLIFLSSSSLAFPGDRQYGIIHLCKFVRDWKERGKKGDDMWLRHPTSSPIVTWYSLFFSFGVFWHDETWLPRGITYTYEKRLARVTDRTPLPDKLEPTIDRPVGWVGRDPSLFDFVGRLDWKIKMARRRLASVNRAPMTCGSEQL
jgi:hypothetical protein